MLDILEKLWHKIFWQSNQLLKKEAKCLKLQYCTSPNNLVLPLLYSETITSPGVDSSHSDEKRVVQHGHACCHAPVSVFRALGPEQVTHALVHQHVFTPPAGGSGGVGGGTRWERYAESPKNTDSHGLRSWLHQTGGEAFTPDVGSEGAQLAEAAGDLQGAVSSEQDVLHWGWMDLIHQDVGHPLRAALHLLQDLGELWVVKVVS